MTSYRNPVDEQPAEEGWWLATDGKWYPPEAHPSVRDAVAAPPETEIRYCGKCGTAVEPSALFCGVCGSDLRAGTSFQSSAVVETPIVTATAPSSSQADAFLLLAAVVLVGIGAFLPWIKATAALVGTVTKSGTEGGDGWFAIAVVVPLAIFGFRRLSAMHSKIPGGLALILSLILGGITIYEISDVSDRVSNVNDAGNGYAHAEIGVGLWMLAIGSALAVIGSLVAMRDSKVQSSP